MVRKMRKRLALLLVIILCLLCASCGSTNYEEEYRNSKQEENNKEKEDSEEEDTDSKGDITGDNNVTGNSEENKESDTKLYEDFLNRNVAVNTEMYPFTGQEHGCEVLGFGGNNELNIEHFFKCIVENRETDYDRAEMTKLDYAYLDCGADGIPELALRATFDYGGDEMVRHFVIKEKEGKLYLTYQNSGFYRSFTDISNKYGLINECISYGAATNYIRVGVLNSEGRYELYYDLNTSYDANLTYDERLSDAVHNDEDKYNLATYLKKYRFEEQLTYSEELSGNYYDDYLMFYYCAQMEEDEPSNGIDKAVNEELLKGLFAEADVKLYTLDEIGSLLEEQRNKLKLTDEMLEIQQINWCNKEIDLSVVNEMYISEREAGLNVTNVTINPGSADLFHWEGKENCYIYIENTNTKYHIGKDTIIYEGVDCYDDGCDAITWLDRYLSHPAFTDEDTESPYYMMGIAFGDMWDIDVDQNNNIVAILGIYYWD